MKAMKLVKSSYDKVLFGVCGGVARFFKIDPTIVRILFALCSILGVGSPVIIYIVLSFIMPEEY